LAPHSDIDPLVRTERTLQLYAQRAGQLGVVGDLWMYVEREMRSVQRDPTGQHRLQPTVAATGNGSVSVPEEPVVDEQHVCIGVDCRAHRGLTRIDRHRDAMYITRALDLETVQGARIVRNFRYAELSIEVFNQLVKLHPARVSRVDNRGVVFNTRMLKSAS